MASPATVSLSLFFLSVGLVRSASDQSNITATAGDDITLPCHDPNHPLIVVQWNRADLGSAFVLRYRDETFDEENQHPSFKNRVDLQDRQMKDGNVSLVLKNVTTNDNGTYECRVQRKGTRAMIKISVISLHVLLPGDKDGTKEDGGNMNESVGLIVGLLVFFTLIIVAGVLLYKHLRQKHVPDETDKPEDPVNL